MCINDNTNQITDISTLQFIHKLCNFMYIISMQNNAAAISHHKILLPAGYASIYICGGVVPLWGT